MDWTSTAGWISSRVAAFSLSEYFAQTVSFATLDCPTLALVEDAATLEIPISATEVLTFSSTFYDAKDGSHFDDDIGREAWGGVGPQGHDERDPAIITMAWATDPCAAETFSLKITSFKTDGSTVVIRSIPCDQGSNINTCLVTLTYAEFLDESDGIEVDDTADPPISSTSLGGGRRNLLLDTSDSASVDVMYLYTEAVLTQLGGISPGQMTSIIYAGVVTTNSAFWGSFIPLTFNVAYVGLFPGTEDPSSASKTLISLPLNGEVAALREKYQADLVQLLGAFTSSCSAAYHYAGLALYGFSVVNPSCMDNYSHSQAFGHNLGCYHNRESTAVVKPYEHGYRACGTQLPGLFYGTIMSLKCAAGRTTRINLFSNTKAIWHRLPSGTTTENCAQGIIDNMRVVENYQPVVVGSTPSPAVVGPTHTVEAIPAPTEAPTIPPTPAYVSLGCWADIGSNRVLTGPADKAGLDMTTETCAEMCVGWAYFGTEFAGECFCGRSVDNPAKRGESTSCVMACSGNAGEICGGANAINVYKYTDYTFEGCFIDKSASRVLTAAATFDGAMSTDLCANYCHGYPFFGTEYGIQCFCGYDTDDLDKHGASNPCDFACPGALAEKCGGFYAISVYKPTEQAIGDEAIALGCYADTPADRVFGHVVFDDALTPERCESACANYKYFGLQYRKECWCGDSANFDRHGMAICDRPCAGDATATCGGIFAMNVYKHYVMK